MCEVCFLNVLTRCLCKRWQDYYPQDWLKRVRAEHCVYSLEVFDPEKPEEALAKLALSKNVFHHPEGRDIALIHFQQEQSSLKLLKNLGVDVLHMRDRDRLFKKGEKMMFDGFVVSEPNNADNKEYANAAKKSDANEDNRIFYPYREEGELSFHTNDRFFAKTPEPLPEGLCGAPALDTDGDLCGTVEGIVPVDHKEKRLAGNAAFMPSYVMKVFVDFVERGMLEQMMPKDLFQMVVSAKETNTIGPGSMRAPDDDSIDEEVNWDELYDSTLEKLRKRYDGKETDAILKAVEDEREEVLEMFDKEGGDMDEIVDRVRQKSIMIRRMIQDQIRKGQLDPESLNPPTEESSSETTAQNE